MYRADATRSRTVERADGPDLHAVEAGPRDAPALLFVHGYAQCHLSWRAQLRSSLADDHRLIAVDLRGHGESATPREGYDDPGAWAGDLRAVVEAFGLREAVFVGWSYGSLVVLDYLAVHGADRAAGVNLVGIVPGVGTDRTTGWLGPGYLDLFPDIASTDAETSAAALARFADLCVRGDLPAADRYLTVGFGSGVPPAVRDAMRDRTVERFDLLESFPVPALLTHGAHDAVVAVDAARDAAGRMPDATLSTYDDCGHAPFLERPDRFGRELRAFVADRS